MEADIVDEPALDPLQKAVGSASGQPKECKSEGRGIYRPPGCLQDKFASECDAYPQPWLSVRECELPPVQFRDGRC